MQIPSSRPMAPTEPMPKDQPLPESNSSRREVLEMNIDANDIDFMGHVNNATYLKWVQAAVLSHWQRVAPPEAVVAYVWIAVKHEITYRKPAFLGNRIVANALLQRVQRESAFYETTIMRENDVLAEVKSRWCCLERNSLCPARLDDATVAHFFSNED